MATVINMPRLSDTMTEGTVATWLKKVGDKINEGDILAEIETDKATMEFESFNSGTLLYIGILEGKTAPVDSLLAIIGNEGEDISKLISGSEKVEDAKNKKQEIAVPVSGSEKNQDTKNPNHVTTVPEEPLVDNNSESSKLPDGVIKITMPRLSDTMTEGTVATWLKKIGDEIKEGDILAEIETDKATMEFESFNAGTLLYIGINNGETAKVNSLLAIIGPAGTDVSSFTDNLTNDAESSIINSPEKTETKDSETKLKINVAEEGQRIFMSPLARKIADEKGININQLKGSGENGRIVKSDVEDFEKTNKEEITNTKQDSKDVKPLASADESLIEKISNSTMRKVIAKRLSESIFTAPHFYLTIEVNMDNAIKSRAIINAIPDTKISFNDMIIKACAMALKKHLKVNSQWSEEAITINHQINIGVAVAVEDGLVVPVLKSTDLMSLTQIGGVVRDLANKAKNKKLTPIQMQDSTFTISNLGMFGITEFTSIINQPNSAILSVGTIVEKPIVKNSQIIIGNTMKVTLACDHRAVDGATGAQFLQTLKIFLENPVAMLA